ncbi:hypothetical protein TTHERM_001198169 (macronuclear) [Tetrahymena thermophila SB210]|uniref:Uncharacterized protein n=1 Tax=Tetrahymena thermophila (strain SB210) TaxID=312017 RepID=W7X9S2_TETTS|nr:hypothetical protein TTHERM_001198169 [Tetrahymena thermophila SB210]EWS76165.1 hypothetical protein TTHERM_001198169 [Tetrahymena thermophila SB210]|eukprot:XP_012651289.1 hypothetical protein TTHERM_001198169 [Tetrahymena thermophila SB210]
MNKPSFIKINSERYGNMLYKEGSNNKVSTNQVFLKRFKEKFTILQPTQNCQPRYKFQFFQYYRRQVSLAQTVSVKSKDIMWVDVQAIIKFNQVFRKTCIIDVMLQFYNESVSMNYMLGNQNI